MAAGGLGFVVTRDEVETSKPGEAQAQGFPLRDRVYF